MEDGGGGGGARAGAASRRRYTRALIIVGKWLPRARSCSFFFYFFFSVVYYLQGKRRAERGRSIIIPRSGPFLAPDFITFKAKLGQGKVALSFHAPRTFLPKDLVPPRQRKGKGKSLQSFPFLVVQIKQKVSNQV